MTGMTRRKLLAALPLSLCALPLAGGRPAARSRAAGPPRILVLVELNGGNDGLNSVIPFADTAYYAARPKLAVARERVLQLDERLGLHPALEPLMTPWQAGEMAIALGVGYQRPNRSHFRSIEIWNSGSSAEESLRDGWLQRVMAETGITAATAPDGFAAQGIVLGGPEGPLAGPALSAVMMRDPRQLGAARRLLDGEQPGGSAVNPALRHILATRTRMQAAALEVERHLADAPQPVGDFPNTAFGRQLALAARLIIAGVPASLFKLQHSGYDTHAQQAGRHGPLLNDLAEGLAAFRQALIAAGAWQRSIVMTYAEFGRRVAENASGGSDHGSAAPQILLGGRIKGGFLGAQPPLDDLEAGDLRPQLDFRRLYAGLAQNWLGLPPAPNSLGRHAPLPLVA